MPDEKLTILMVDDNPADAEAVRRALGKLQDLDIELCHCLTAEEGLETLSRLDVCCVFLDHLLGSTTGLEVLEEIRAAENDVPVIVLTGQGDEKIAVEAMKLGAQDYIPKGRVTPQALRRILFTSLERVSLQRKIAERREELEILGYTTARSLRQPLAGMTEGIDRLREELATGELQQADEHLDALVVRIDEMSLIIQEVLEYTRSGHSADPFAEFELGAVVDEVVREISMQLTEIGAEIETGHLPRVRGDRSGIRHVLSNLLTNAIAFRSEAPPCIRVYAHLEHDYWYVTVEDNGIGIEAKDYDLVFRPLTRLNPAVRHRGHGIGLASCKKIIEQHEGRIWVQSQPGRGAAFRFTLPAPSWRGLEVPRTAVG